MVKIVLVGAVCFIVTACLMVYGIKFNANWATVLSGACLYGTYVAGLVMGSE